MKIHKLTVTNVRALKHETFAFKPGMNLLVGLNGLGKTTVLDALRILSAQVLPHANEIRGDSLAFNSDDIRVPASALTAVLECEVPGVDITYTAHQSRTEYKPKEGGNVRDTVTETPKRNSLVAHNKYG
jgi:predicted ATP-binding protein involved in virulence